MTTTPTPFVQHLDEYGDDPCRCGIAEVTPAVQEFLKKFDEWYGDKAYRKHNEVIGWAENLVSPEKPALTAQQQAVIDAAKKLARHIAGEIDPDDRCPEEQALLAAVTGLKPPASALPPIPEPGIYADAHAGLWIIHPNGSMALVGTDTECSWESGQDYGPFVHYVPATDVVDAGIVRELAEALRKAQDQLCGHFKYLPFVPLPGQRPTQLVEVALDECENPEYGCAEVRDLLARARAEGATGGGR